jgi:hypothetical protein
VAGRRIVQRRLTEIGPVLRCPVPQEPAVLARWVYRAVAGETAGPARRILAGLAVALLVIALSIVVPVSVLALLSAIAALFAGFAVPEATPDRLTIAWGLVAVTSVGLVGAAAAVSWTSGRRARHRRGREPAPASPGDHDQERRSDPEDERATSPPVP